MTILRRGSIGIIVTSVAIWVSGCTAAASPAQHEIDVYEAKATVLKEAKSIVDLIPSKFVEAYNQRTEAAILRCSAVNEYNWPGHANIELRENPDIDELLDRIAEAYERPGFRVKRGALPDGSPELVISSDSGATYILMTSRDGESIEFGSFSSCFTLKEGQTVFDRY